MEQVTKSKENRRLAILMGVAAALLCLPLIAMQFSTGVKWSAFDFIIVGILLGGTALGCEAVLRAVKTTKARIIAVGAILLALFLVWAELAVGIFGTPVAGS